MKIRRLEIATLMLLAMLTVALLSRFYTETTLVRHLDSVFLFESVAAIARTGKPVSATVASWVEVAKTLHTSPDQVCLMPLGSSNSLAYNVLHNHAYVALYPITLLSMVSGPEGAFAVLNAMAHLALPFIAYLFLRSRRIAIFPAAMFALSVICYPGWSLSAFGDYYLDRLYMPFMLLLLCLLHPQGKPGPSFSRGWLAAIVCAAFAAASMTERAAMMVIVTLVFFWALFPALRRDSKMNWVLIGLAVCLAAYLECYLRFLHQGFAGGGSLLGNALLTREQLVLRMQHPAIATFFWTNLLFIGWLTLFAGWRYALLLVGAIAPNLLITIGGAELNGWSTHYHTMYIPFLIFVASVGFIELNRLLAPRILRIVVPMIVGCLSVASAGYFDPYTARWGKNFGVDGNSGITRAAYRFFVTPQLSAEWAMAYWLRTLDQAIPATAKVSAIEGVMPALYRTRRLALYPYNIDAADYLVLSGSAVNGKPVTVSGAPTSLPQPAEDQLNACLMKRALDRGFTLDRDVSPVGVLIFKKTR